MCDDPTVAAVKQESENGNYTQQARQESVAPTSYPDTVPCKASIGCGNVLQNESCPA